ncbi:MAG TPA: 1-deoxy-D-xylulose-5-phosphate reductoisomerase [Bacteroidales bacterium]|nr:1-deoxy-D-xylulose-5-phosphate reductoisomerase [Bacteroidales bacterium]HXK90642.1 1-deoxy-D-xylulose-5-phosphate reductoisomerase [Bacteroidales bacterium]
MSEKIRLAILGSTGSIGRQTLDLVRMFPDVFSVEALTANDNVDLLIKQALEYHPNTVVINNEALYLTLKESLKDTDIKVFAGAESINHVAESENIDELVIALVGFAGLQPTLRAAKAGKRMALATKEALVVAGELVFKAIKDGNASLVPIDSEHSAIFQCLQGENLNTVSKLILTASGGPFKNRNAEDFDSITIDEALSHPSWQMGDKITIDSATMMNKGFEVIEAHWLFGINPNNIDVVIHPESIIHSMIAFVDGSIKAQLAIPDMRIPILYSLTYPYRLPTNIATPDFIELHSLTFEKPNLTLFPHLQLAYDTLKVGGIMPCALNAANEVAVRAFLNNEIKFNMMYQVIVKTLETVNHAPISDLEQLINIDAEVRRKTKEIIKQII